MSVSKKATKAVLRVGGGRGFLVRCQSKWVRDGRIIITAAHCLPKKLPPAHPARAAWEETYKNLLGPLGAKRTVWAKCLFVDPLADIAVLGRPDYQALWQPDNEDLLAQQAEAYDQLMKGMALSVADAPAMKPMQLCGAEGQPV